MAYLLGLVPTILTLGTIYALAASGYTLIHAVTRRFHLAVGALFALGAYVCFIAFAMLDILGVQSALAIVGAAAAIALAASAAGGAALHAFHLVRPGAGANPTAPLVVTVGLLIASAEAIRLLHESHTLFLPPPLTGTAMIRAGGELFVVPVRVLAVFPVGLAAWIAAALLLARSRLGRAVRAVADDPGMARLLGISVDRTVLCAFVVGGLLAGFAGMLSTERYGAVWPYMGLLLGLKAIAAAIIGGIGSLGGALVVGFVIAGVETLWTAYVSGEYRDIALFALLVLALIFRPDGLFARPVVDPISGPGGARH